ncbi:MAG: hypothetical protein JJV93_00210 [Alphaproteobacteria bacterium]|nr:hypothetical protein [Alphaproteobacteria bacterium]
MDRKKFENIISQINDTCDKIQEFEDVTKPELIKKNRFGGGFGEYLSRHSFDVSNIKKKINKLLDIDFSIFYDNAEILAIQNLIQILLDHCNRYNNGNSGYLFTEEHYNNTFKNNRYEINELIDNLQTKNYEFETIISIVTNNEIKKFSDINKIYENIEQSKTALESIKTNENASQIAMENIKVATNTIGVIKKAEGFATIAEKSHKKAQKYEWVIFIFALLLMGLVVLAFIKIDSIFFSRLIFLVPLFTVSLIYLIILEKRYRIRAFKYKDLEVSILSLSAYLGDISDKPMEELSAKDTFKLKMAEFYYKQVYDETKIKEKNITELVTSTIKSAKGTT